MRSMIPFCRLSVISFLCSFVFLFLALMAKQNELIQQNITLYRYSPDFIRILGSGLFVFLITLICLNKFKIYQFTLRNILFIIISVVIGLLVMRTAENLCQNWLMQSYDIFNSTNYQSFIFFSPLIVRSIGLFLLAIVLFLFVLLYKKFFNIVDDICPIDIDEPTTRKKLQVVLFCAGYLAIGFIFQRYLYVALYLYNGITNISEYNNITFYAASALLIMLLVPNVFRADYIDNNLVLTNAKLILAIVIIQIIASLVSSLITVEGVNWYFQANIPATDEEKYTHYILFLKTLLNSMFIVPIVTILITYLAGRLVIRKLSIAE